MTDEKTNPYQDQIDEYEENLKGLSDEELKEAKIIAGVVKGGSREQMENRVNSGDEKLADKAKMKLIEMDYNKQIKEILETDKKEIKKTFALQQREALHIPEHLNEKPVLYISSNRELYNNKEITYLDLSVTPKEQIYDCLTYHLEKLDPSNDQILLENINDKKNVGPLPKFMINVLYLPPLDKNGKPVNHSSSTGFAFDRTSSKFHIRDSLKFMEENGAFTPSKISLKMDTKRLSKTS